MGDRCQRPRLVPHSSGPRPRRYLFHGRRQHPPPRFDGLMGVAYLQELFGLPLMFPWTPGPTLPMEHLPYYYVQRPYPVFPLFPMLPSWMVPAISYEVALNQGSPRQPRANPDVTRNDAPPRPPKRHVVKRRRSRPPPEQGTQAVRSKATRARTRKSAVPSTSETLRSSPSKEEQQEYIELVLSRLLRTAADLGLSVPAKKEEPRCAARKFIYSAAMLRCLNAHNRTSTPASRSEHLDENPEGSGTSAGNVRE
ncbi:hypothetical protein HPB51_026770 [Rhipicephalus microplus]|uniref:Uncharacterized protein n=1 Tax=Rhipicephalus microplus TaxID=6941 RepID=A0A9J6D1U6_RHIMP|nr:hypothetical protein HPB51_026770 [Rhipicephalus microplus]